MTTRHSDRRITVLALGLSVGVFLGSGLATGQDAVPAALSADDIVNRIGSEPETKAVIQAVLMAEFGHDRRSTPEFFLSSQVQADWLPSLEGIRLVLLSDAQTTSHLASCGTYQVLQDVERSGDSVVVGLSLKCGASYRRYRVVFDGGQWRIPGGPGIGSGFVGGYPPECPCLGR